jgi:hypothetical protein
MNLLLTTMKGHLTIFIVFLNLVVSIPVFSQNKKKPFFFQFSYGQLQERYYSSALEFLEIPFTVYYNLVEDRLSIHAGLSTRWYFTGSRTTPGFQGHLEDVTIDPYNVGIITMLKFSASPLIDVSLDYFLGLKKLNVTKSLQSDTEYHLTGTFAQVSLFVKPFSKGGE